MRLRKIMLTVVLFLLIIQVFAKEMNLYRNYEGATEFATLTLDEQYCSYINSFIDKGLIKEQPMKWAFRMVRQYKRDILPYLNNSITDFEYENYNTDNLIVCIDYVIYALEEENLLTPLELQLYQMIFASKLETYVAKHKVIDEIVIDNFGYLTYDTFITGENTIFPPRITPESLKEYYEAKLGITVEIAEELK